MDRLNDDIVEVICGLLESITVIDRRICPPEKRYIMAGSHLFREIGLFHPKFEYEFRSDYKTLTEAEKIDAIGMARLQGISESQFASSVSALHVPTSHPMNNIMPVFSYDYAVAFISVLTSCFTRFINLKAVYISHERLHHGYFRWGSNSYDQQIRYILQEASSAVNKLRLELSQSCAFPSILSTAPRTQLTENLEDICMLISPKTLPPDYVIYFGHNRYPTAAYQQEYFNTFDHTENLCYLDLRCGNHRFNMDLLQNRSFKRLKGLRLKRFGASAGCLMDLLANPLLDSVMLTEILLVTGTWREIFAHLKSKIGGAFGLIIEDCAYGSWPEQSLLTRSPDSQMTAISLHMRTKDSDELLGLLAHINQRKMQTPL